MMLICKHYFNVKVRKCCSCCPISNQYSSLPVLSVEIVESISMTKEFLLGTKTGFANVFQLQKNERFQCQTFQKLISSSRQQNNRKSDYGIKDVGTKLIKNCKD